MPKKKKIKEDVVEETATAACPKCGSVASFDQGFMDGAFKCPVCGYWFRMEG